MSDLPMDPLSITASIAGIVLTVEQILSAVYKYGKGVQEAKTERGQLCSELFALKAALEHVRMNAQYAQESTDQTDEPQALSSSIFQTPHFTVMLSTTRTTLEELLKRLTEPQGRVRSALYSVTWSLKKEDVKQELVRLDRFKSYFVLATTSDNMYCLHLPNPRLDRNQT